MAQRFIFYSVVSTIPALTSREKEVAAEVDKPSAIAVVAVVVIVSVIGVVVVMAVATAEGRDKDPGGGTTVEATTAAEGGKVATGRVGRPVSSGSNVIRLVSMLRPFRLPPPAPGPLDWPPCPSDDCSRQRPVQK